MGVGIMDNNFHGVFGSKIMSVFPDHGDLFSFCRRLFIIFTTPSATLLAAVQLFKFESGFFFCFLA